MMKNFNRNPEGFNQWKLRTNEEIQKIINSYPSRYTKKDFRGEGVNNSRKILTRKETERASLKFGFTGKKKQPLKEVYKHSTPESIAEFEKSQIDEDTFRNRAKQKKIRDDMSFSERKDFYKKEYAKLTEDQLESKRIRNIKYRDRIKNAK